MPQTYIGCGVCSAYCPLQGKKDWKKKVRRKKKDWKKKVMILPIETNSKSAWGPHPHPRPQIMLTTCSDKKYASNDLCICLFFLVLEKKISSRKIIILRLEVISDACIDCFYSNFNNRVFFVLPTFIFLLFTHCRQH